MIEWLQKVVDKARAEREKDEAAKAPEWVYDISQTMQAEWCWRNTRTGEERRITDVDGFNSAPNAIVGERRRELFKGRDGVEDPTLHPEEKNVMANNSPEDLQIHMVETLHPQLEQQARASLGMAPQNFQNRF